VNVTFKYVGQGDCIVIEWVDNESRRVGVVDCCHSLPNAAISHIQQGDYSSVEFVLLSHPHQDHFSGIESLLLFCEENRINIRYFLHTCGANPQYLMASLKAAVSFEAHTPLANLFRTMRRLKRAGVISKVVNVNDLNCIPLSDTISLDVLSPSYEEHQRYNRTTYHVDLSTKNNPAANWLSTILKLSRNGRYILLTSDAKRRAMMRVYSEHLEDAGRNLIGGQAPHHGAGSDHYRLLWRSCRANNNNPTATISVGPNSYGHPSLKTINDLRARGYDVKCTGKIADWRIPTRHQRALAGISTLSSPRAYFDGGGSDVRLTL